MGWFMGSFLGLWAMHMGLEPKTLRTAAFRLLPRALRSRALKRPKGHGPEERFMGRDGAVLVLIRRTGEILRKSALELNG